MNPDCFCETQENWGGKNRSNYLLVNESITLSAYWLDVLSEFILAPLNKPQGHTLLSD